MRKAACLALALLAACAFPGDVARARAAARCAERGGRYAQTYDFVQWGPNAVHRSRVWFCARRDSIPLAPRPDSTATPTPVTP